MSTLQSAIDAAKLQAFMGKMVGDVGAVECFFRGSYAAFLIKDWQPEPDGVRDRLGEVVTAAGFSRFRRATETPFNLILEARP